MILPIRRRLALVSAVLVAALIVVLGAVVYLRLASDLFIAVDDELQTRAEALVHDGSSPVLDLSPTDVGDIFAQLVGRDGRVIATTPGLAANGRLPIGDPATLDGPRFVEAQLATPEDPVPVRMLATPADDGTIVIVGVAIDDQREALATLLQELAIALPVAILLAAGVGWFVAGAALRPVERIRLEAEAISASEPARRLPVPGTRDELTALGVSLNGMLDRLQAAVERERRFVDDASHELRTPLANLKAELDLAMRRSRTQEELMAALGSAAEETDRLTRLAEDLLVLARSEGGGLPIRREEVDVSRLVRDTVDSFAGRASTLAVALRVVADGMGTASVDPVRLRQALGNLIDNGIRHADAGGLVTVTLLQDQSGLTMTVVDSGAGFPPAFLPRAFLPFSRADAVRSRSDGGAGLGLAIVQAVVEAHGGTVLARNRPESGGEVVLRIPS